MLDIVSQAVGRIFADENPAIEQMNDGGRGGEAEVIYHQDGRIITNNHVVARDDARVQIMLADGRKLNAKVLHRNPRLDLALLKVEAEQLKALPVGDSSQLRVGEWVFAIGHPWGQRWVMTAGIASRIRSVKLADDLTTQYIQSDVGLAPGNSGGPMLNADGQVVGINAMIFGGDLSVAIPSDVVKAWLAELPRRRTTLGVEITTVELPVAIRHQLQPERHTGVMIVGIREERQAHHNDLLLGDVVLEVAGAPVKGNADLLKLLAESEERNTILLRVLRGGQLVTLDVATVMRERNM